LEKTATRNIDVNAVNGQVTLSLNKKVLLVERLEKELEEIAMKVNGVNSVKIVFGKNYYEADIYRKMDFELPSRVILVDDEKEFVQTLSEQFEDKVNKIVYTYLTL
jgi:hypothetical protein